MILEEVKQQIYKLREEGKSILDISIQLRVGKASVSFWCNKFDPEKKFNHTNKIKKDQIQPIIDYYKSCLSLKKTGIKFNVAGSTIRGILLKNQCYIIKPKETKKQTSRRKSLNVINWKKDKKKKLIEYKGGKCQICGYDRCEQALDFHHIDPSQKDFDISSNSYSFEKMKIEADKCALLCSNCHREVHAGFIKLDKVALEAEKSRLLI